MRWFFRSRDSLVPTPTTPQCPLLIDLEKRVQELDSTVNALKFHLLELHFYIIGPTRSPSPKPPPSTTTTKPSPTTYTDRHTRTLAAAADADETLTYFIEKLTALGPRVTALQAEIEARRASSAEDALVSTPDAVENLCGYVREVDSRYRRIWERIDGVLAMGMGGWEVGLARTVLKELDPLELRAWR